MDPNPQRTKPLALEPIAPTSDDDAPAKRQLRITIADEFVAEAAKEYQDGHIDRALWSRASHAGDDEALVVASYLRARATALRMERRDKHSDPPGGEAARNETALPLAADIQSTKAPAPQRRAKRPMLLAGAVIALVVTVGVALMIAAQRHVETPDPPAVSSASSATSPQPPDSPAHQQPAARNSGGNAGRSEAASELEAKVRQLKDAANWNVLVLYASEWTRQEPANAAAWNDLSVGYANLRQFDDALNAATKAVQLAPADALLWRNLGQVNLALERLPDAAAAFDNALLVSPGDIVALCGALSVAQLQGRSKDADAMAARVKSMDGNCPDAGGAEKAVAVPSTPRKSQMPTAR